MKLLYFIILTYTSDNYLWPYLKGEEIGEVKIGQGELVVEFNNFCTFVSSLDYSQDSRLINMSSWTSSKHFKFNMVKTASLVIAS